MNVFTKHPHEQGVSYFEHWVFAAGVAWRLLQSVFAFTIHGLLPFITIERRLDFEATSEYLLERNRFIEQAAGKLSGVTVRTRDRVRRPVSALTP